MAGLGTNGLGAGPAPARVSVERDLAGRIAGGWSGGGAVNPMGFVEWAGRSGEKYGRTGDVPLAFLNRMNPAMGWVNRKAATTARTYGNDEDGWERLEKLSTLGLMNEGFLLAGGKEGLAELWANRQDKEALRRFVYKNSRRYLRVTKGFEQEQEERKPTGAAGLVDRGGRGAIDMLGYMGQIAIGATGFVAVEGGTRYMEGRAPDVELGADGSLGTSRAPAGRMEAATKGLLGAAATYTIEKWAGDYVGGMLRRGSTGAVKRLLPRQARTLARKLAAKAKGAFPVGLSGAMKGVNKATGFGGLFEEIFVEEGLEAAVNAIGDLEYEYANSDLSKMGRLSDAAGRFLTQVPEMAVSMVMLRGGQYAASIPFTASEEDNRRTLAAIDGNDERARSVPAEELPETVNEAFEENVTDDDQAEVVRTGAGKMGEHGFEVPPEEVESALAGAKAVRMTEAAAEASAAAVFPDEEMEPAAKSAVEVLAESEPEDLVTEVEVAPGVVVTELDTETLRAAEQQQLEQLEAARAEQVAQAAEEGQGNEQNVPDEQRRMEQDPGARGEQEGVVETVQVPEVPEQQAAQASEEGGGVEDEVQVGSETERPTPNVERPTPNGESGEGEGQGKPSETKRLMRKVKEFEAAKGEDRRTKDGTVIPADVDPVAFENGYTFGLAGMGPGTTLDGVSPLVERSWRAGHAVAKDTTAEGKPGVVATDEGLAATGREVASEGVAVGTRMMVGRQTYAFTGEVRDDGKLVFRVVKKDGELGKRRRAFTAERVQEAMGSQGTEEGDTMPQGRGLEEQGTEGVVSLDDVAERVEAEGIDHRESKRTTLVGKAEVEAARDKLLTEVDKALAEAPAQAEAQGEPGMLVFDVPNDGTFRVENVKERLEVFRDRLRKGFRVPERRGGRRTAPAEVVPKAGDLPAPGTHFGSAEKLAEAAESYRVNAEMMAENPEVFPAKEVAKERERARLYAEAAEKAEKLERKGEQEEDKVGTEETTGEKVAQAEGVKGRTGEPTPQGRGLEQAETGGHGEDGIQDFGEKLGGARKDLAAQAAREFSDDELAALPLSKIWPKGDVDGIEDAELAALAHAVRSEIPAKPRTARKVARWVEQVKVLRGLMQELSAEGGEEFLAKLGTDGSRALGRLAAKIRLLREVDREHWGRIGMVENRPDSKVRRDGAWVAYPHVVARVDGREVPADGFAELAQAVSERLKEAREKGRMEFEIRVRRSDRGHVFVNRKGDPLRRPLRTFASVEEARAFVREHREELVQAWEELKERENVKERDVRRDENRARTGRDYRGGEDATPEMFQGAFGFRGVEFGNWVSQGRRRADRQGMLNAAYDALMDLAEVVGVPPQALSLNGTLGLGFGSRGSGWASAHYEADTLVINLTKTRGAGALAHEWFHALDNYFQRKRGVQGREREDMFVTYRPEPQYRNGRWFLSEKRYESLRSSGQLRDAESWERVEGVRPEVERAFAELVRVLNASPMAQRSRLIDKGQSNGYWGRVLERAARAFENYAISRMAARGQQNDYLANVVGVEEFEREASRYPYLLDEELAPVAEAFEGLFATVKTRETEQGVELYRDVEEALGRGDRARLRALGRRLFGDDWLRLRERVLTPEGREVMGRYQDGWADVSEGKGDPESTVLHEAVHRAEGLFLTTAELAGLRGAMPDAEARAEGIVRYAREGKGLVGKVRRMVGRLLRRLRRFLGRPGDVDELLDFYDRLLAGGFARRGAMQGASLTVGPLYASDEALLAKPPVPVLDAGERMGAPAASWGEIEPLAGSEVTNADSGIAINATKASLRHSFFRKYTPESGAIHRVLLDLLRTSVLTEDYAPRKAGDEHSLSRMLVFHGAARVDGKVYRVKMKAKQFIDPNRGVGHYDLQAVEIDEAAKVTDDGQVAMASPFSAASTITVHDLLRDAKRDDGTLFFAADGTASRRGPDAEHPRGVEIGDVKRDQDSQGASRVRHVVARREVFAGRRLSVAATRRRLRAAFPGATVTDLQLSDRDGFVVELPDGRRLTVLLMEEIPIDPEDFRATYSRELEEDEVAAGAWYTAWQLMQLARIADGEDIDHESWHAARELAALTPAELTALDAEFHGDAEAEARAYANWTGTRRTAWQRAFGKIRRFFRRVAKAMGLRLREDWREAFEVVRSGEVWGRKERIQESGVRSQEREGENGEERRTSNIEHRTSNEEGERENGEWEGPDGSRTRVPNAGVAHTGLQARQQPFKTGSVASTEAEGANPGGAGAQGKIEAEGVSGKYSMRGNPGDAPRMESLGQAREFLTGEPVAELKGDEFPKGERSLVAMVQEQYREDWGGQVERPGLGTVKLSRRGIKDSIAHGIGRAKVVAFAAVPEVIRSGMELGQREAAHGVSPRLTLAAPITIAGVPHVAVVILKEQARTHQFYLHEVVVTERLQQPFKTGAGASAIAEGERPSGAGAIKTLLQDIFDVKQDGGVKPASSRVEPTSSETTPVSVQPAGFNGRMPGEGGDVKGDGEVRYSVRKRRERGEREGEEPRMGGASVELTPHGGASNGEAEEKKAETGVKAAVAGGIDVVLRILKSPKRSLKLLRGTEDNRRRDLGLLDTWLLTPSHFSKVSPAREKMQEAAQDGVTRQWELRNQIFGNKRTNDDDLEWFQHLERTDKATYRAGDRYLWEMDREERAGTVQAVRERGEDSPILAYAAVTVDGRALGSFAAQSDAWRAVFDAEAATLKSDRGLAFAEMVRRAREVNLRGYLQLKHGIDGVVKEREEAGDPTPSRVTYTLEDGTTQAVDLFEALRVMGERLGYYMPRLRSGGRMVLKGFDETGRYVWRSHYDTRAGRLVAQIKMERDNPGWAFEQELSDQPSEDAYAGAFNLQDVQDLVNRAMEGVDEAQNAPKTLKDMGMDPQRVTYTRKDGKEEEHLVLVPGRMNSQHAQVLKQVFGARFYDDGQNGLGKAWHIVNPTAEQEASIVKVLMESAGVPEGLVVEAFARAFAMSMANVLHERGSRARKIQRQEAVGGEVVRGYTEDTVKALAQNGASIAAGTAKSETLKKMMRAMMGMDEPWLEFRQAWMVRQGNENGGALTKEEERAERMAAWEAWRQQVKERRIDSATQPRLYKEAKGFLLEMFRNEEPIERIMGVLKGVATLKFLSGVMPGVVNLTAMASTVPAILAEAGYSNRRVAKLVGLATRDYGAYMTKSRWGRGDGVDEETERLLDEISRRGWDEQQFHQASVNALKSKLGRGMGRVMDVAMWMFSTTEQLNRGSTVLAGYRAMRELHPDWTEEQALKAAKTVSDRAHGQYGKTNMWAPARGGGMGAQILRSMYMYMTFGHTMVQNTAQMVVRGSKAAWQRDGAKAKANLTGAAWMLVAPAVLAGAGASMLVPLAKAVFSAVGSEPPEEVEEEFYDWLADTFGDGGEAFGRFGLAGLLGVNIKGSLATNPFEVPLDLSRPPRSWLDLMGPMGSMVGDVAKVPDLMARGQMIRAIETGFAPRMVRGPLRAWREMMDGPKSWSGARMRDREGDQVQVGLWDSVVRAISGNPARVAREVERNWHEREAREFYGEIRKGLYARARGLGYPTGETQGQWAALFADIQAYNTMTEASSMGISGITDRVLRREMRKEHGKPDGDGQGRQAREPRKGRARRQGRVGR